VILQVAAVHTSFLRGILHTTSLDARDWAVVVACALLPVVVVELVKLVQRRA
jgi:hypothetical protein